MKLFKKHFGFSGVEKSLAELNILVQITVDGVHHISDVFNRIVQIVKKMAEVFDGLILNLLEDVINVTVMGVKGAPVDVGPVGNVLYRNFEISFSAASSIKAVFISLRERMALRYSALLPMD